MFAEYLWMMRLFLKLVPLVVVVGLVVFPVWDWLYPWKTASEALAAYGPQLRLCVATGSSTEGAVLKQRRDYVLLPRLFVSPDLITVTETVRESLEDRKLVVEESTKLLLLLVSVYGLCLWLTLRWWVRPIRRGGREALRLAI